MFPFLFFFCMEDMLWVFEVGWELGFFWTGDWLVMTMGVWFVALRVCTMDFRYVRTCECMYCTVLVSCCCCCCFFTNSGLWLVFFFSSSIHFPVFLSDCVCYKYPTCLQAYTSNAHARRNEGRQRSIVFETMGEGAMSALWIGHRRAAYGAWVTWDFSACHWDRYLGRFFVSTYALCMRNRSIDEGAPVIEWSEGLGKESARHGCAGLCWSRRCLIWNMTVFRRDLVE